MFQNLGLFQIRLQAFLLITSMLDNFHLILLSHALTEFETLLIDNGVQNILMKEKRN